MAPIQPQPQRPGSVAALLEEMVRVDLGKDIDKQRGCFNLILGM
jgi:hypothetical protein